MQYESVIIGHVTCDKNTDHLGNVINAPGGAVLFSSASAFALGHRVAAVTKVSNADKELLMSGFTIPNRDIYCLPSVYSTHMENTYFTPDKEKRKSVCVSRGDVFYEKDIPDDIQGEIYHLAGLLYGDYEDDLIIKLHKKGRVAVDVQGYLRHADLQNGGTLYFKDWERKKELFPYIDFLKTDAAEAEILTGVSDRAQAAKMLYEMGAREVLITHNSEVLAFDGKNIYTCPIRSRNISGRTGRGDTTFSAYITERLTNNIENALLTATATVSLKMEAPGPIKADRSDIIRYIEEFYR